MIISIFFFLLFFYYCANIIISAHELSDIYMIKSHLQRLWPLSYYYSRSVMVLITHPHYLELFCIKKKTPTPTHNAHANVYKAFSLSSPFSEKHELGPYSVCRSELQILQCVLFGATPNKFCRVCDELSRKGDSLP